ncbi:hypothetical protein PHYSODRAFT_343849 [Phytophthora sojae]|uniref:Uncharacterized protein n=1 Tax=Phytophthora sojae (strain P6497) TaxID=1094619 RepID=G4YHD4_PHYSP|nr:hypothetical protein PHYSODRAFT_343849 [Phytophthora sojae]EGZ28453.1 hypothetical protein PHYSODRAFT_343849 [Phytophthora sojae]|eukprot:XP_009515728.1 hypothetical protein PHYSODRAFT_343849 [Phytophthora sojae]
MEAPLSVTVSMAPSPAKPKRSLDLRDMMDELPMLASLKDQKWMARLPRNMFPALKKSPRHNAGDSSPTSGSETDTTLLSPGFLPTPRTARAMSVLVPSTDEEVLDALDPRFFTESFDPVAHMLENIPENKTELNVFLRTEISAVDVAKDVILTRLQDDVRANYNSLIQGMKVVQEVDLDLVRAQIHVKNGRRLLATAKNDLILSSLEIVKTKRNRDRVSEIVSFGSQIVNFFDDEEKMNEALQEHQFITAVDICVGLRKGLSREELKALTILDEIRVRMQDFIPRLRKQFDQSLRKVAGHFDPLEYNELLQAYITLADHSENLGFEFSSYTLNEVLSNIPEIIVRSIDDMTSEFMRQVFEAVSPKKLKAGIKTSQLKDNNASKAGDPVTPASQTVENVKRCYEHLTDLMHTYYLLVQWHRDPFNPLNDDVAYLHRCGIDDDDDDDDDTDEDDDHDDRRFHHSHSKHGHVLCDTGMTLLRYRKIVWESIQQNVLEMIEKLDMAYGYKMEHIIALSLATTTFTEIGEEFTGAPSSKIRSVLRVKCEQYLHAFHDDNIELARMLLDTENWLRVTASTTDGDDNAGLLRLIEKRSGYFFEQKSSALIYPSSADTGNLLQQNSPMSRKVTLRKVSRTPAAVEDADESNLYALAERSIACEAIVGQCRLMNAIEDLARSYLPDRYLCLMDEVYERNRTMARELRNFMYNSIATKLVDVPVLLDSVSAVSWDIPYISDQHNEYIVHLVQKCGEAWGGLQILADGSIPLDAREDIWAAMVQTIMDTLLQAFSTVPKPTPQGRALMLLDLHALQNGLDLINHISSRTVPRGREYVGSYIKAFYYDEDELLEWAKANKTLYTKVQFANLLKNGIGSTLDIKTLRELVLKIDALIS